MVAQNLHAHCTFDDGKNTPEEMVRASQAAGLTSVGLSLHGPLPFETPWAARREEIPSFLREMRRLREAYAGEIRVYAGVEWDVLCEPVDRSAFDYVIGSVHHLPADGGFFAVDESPQATQRILRLYFGGDANAAAGLYYEQVERLARVPEVDVVGHVDLITKFNERHGFFDENSPAYRRAALRALEALVAEEKIFEINTGAISRGWRTTPYPSRALLREIARMGGRVTVSADAHGVEAWPSALSRRERLRLHAVFGRSGSLRSRVERRPSCRLGCNAVLRFMESF